MKDANYRIGQVIEGGQAVGIFGDGAPRWHGLIVNPMREDQAEDWLKLRGVYGFHPVRVRVKKIHGASRRIVSRYLPGYVFARFPGQIVAHRVIGTPFIRDMIRLADGRPAALDPHDLRALHAMRDVDEETRQAEAERRRAERDRSRVRKGDMAILLTGVMAGHHVEVLELRAGRARFNIRMFGADIPAEVDAGELQKVSP